MRERLGLEEAKTALAANLADLRQAKSAVRAARLRLVRAHLDQIRRYTAADLYLARRRFELYLADEMPWAFDAWRTAKADPRATALLCARWGGGVLAWFALMAAIIAFRPVALFVTGLGATGLIMGALYGAWRTYVALRDPEFPQNARRALAAAREWSAGALHLKAH